MEVITLSDIEMLARIHDPVCLSLYLPTFRSGQEVRQNAVRFKNLVARAEGELRARDMKERQIGSFLAPLERLVADKYFWEHQQEGLVLFRTPRRYFSYCAPVAFEEELVVGRRLRLRPLFSLFSGTGKYYVLALGHRRARLYLCTSFGIVERPLPGPSAGAGASLHGSRGPRRARVHTLRSSGRGFGAHPAAFRGQGDSKDREKAETTAYFRQVNAAIVRALRGERVPLVLAGLEFLCPLYREVNSYPVLLDAFVDANAETLKGPDLRAASRTIVEPAFREFEEQKVRSFHALSETGRVSTALPEIVPSAVCKRVDTLFIAKGHSEWPQPVRIRALAAAAAVEEHYREDLVDIAAVHTLINGGTVFVVSPHSVPGGMGCAALYRF